MLGPGGPLQQIVLRFGPGYIAEFGERMPQRHRRALFAIGACRTAALGGHTEVCCDCGTARFVPRSCRHVLCPACHGAEIEHWLAARADEVLPVPYFHVTFPLPSELRQTARRRYTAICGAMPRAAAEALQILALDRLGGRLGIAAAVHTWGRTLQWHPHVHCLVPGVVVQANGQFRILPDSFLLPVEALSQVYRAVFLRLVRTQPDAPSLPPIPWSKQWIVNCRACHEGPANVLRYLARYTRRGPLAESNILSISDEQVAFRYVSHAPSPGGCGGTGRSGRPTTCKLHPHEFLRRYLQHTPPRGFHRVRYYGFLAPGARGTLQALRSAMLSCLALVQPVIAELRQRICTPYVCPQCGCAHFVRKDFLPPNRRAPPWGLAA